MLTRKLTPLSKQRGISMFITLMVLIPLMLAAVALTRSVDTAGIIIGNLSYKQASIHAADCGIETAIKWLQTNQSTGLLNDNGFAAGYAARRQDPVDSQSWGDFWPTLAQSGAANQVLTVNNLIPNPCPTSSGYQVAYVIHRMCSGIGDPSTTDCSQSTSATTTSGNSRGAGAVAPTTFSNQTYYRITVRVDGPRNTVSYVQVIVAQ